MNPAAPDFAPTLVGKLFALRTVQPFDRLPDDELTLLAETAVPRAYEPAAIVHGDSEPLTRLLVVVGGGLRGPAGEVAGPILGVASLLNRTSAPRLSADPEQGALVLEIGGRHFFTLARECPQFVLGLLELGEQGRSASTP